MNPYSFASTFFSVSTLIISFLIWSRRRNKVNGIYFLFSFFVAIWAMSVAMIFSNDMSRSAALFWGRLTNASALFIPVTWFHFSLVYTRKEEKYKEALFFLYAATVVVDLFAFTPWLVSSVGPIGVFKNYPRPGFLFVVFTIVFFAVVPLGFIRLGASCKKAFGQERQRLIGLMIAASTGFFGGSMTFLPVYGVDIPMYGIFLMPLYPFIMAYFIGRKNLLDEYEIAHAAQRDKLAAIGMLVASINHEIRNPLYIIQDCAEVFIVHALEKGGRNPEEELQRAEEAMKKINRHAERALQIIRKLSAIAHVGREKQERSEEAVCLLKTFENVVPLVRHELVLDRIELVNRIPADLPSVRADSGQIEEVFFNLIVNACQAVTSEFRHARGDLRSPSSQAMKTGGKIEVSAREKNAAEIEIKVQDTGRGIAPAEMSQIFEPFFTTREEGTGLGLYITKQIVENNGGRITVESLSGRGTTFTLTFQKHSEAR